MVKVNSNQTSLNLMKHDIEVYLGFYMIAMTFIGAGSLVAIMLYFQFMRVRYMVNYGCQAAWKRMDDTIKKNVLDSPRCPSIVRTIYQKVKGFMISMVPDPQAEAARQAAAGGGAGGGGIGGAVRNAMSNCTTF